MKFGFFFCFLQVDVQRIQIQRRWNFIKILSFLNVVLPWMFEIRQKNFCLVLVLFRGLSKRRDLSNRVYVSEEIREEAFSRAEKFQDELGSGHPSFVKSMLQSHVSGGFWLVINFRIHKIFSLISVLFGLSPSRSLHCLV